jgi:hypothetical protein
MKDASSSNNTDEIAVRKYLAEVCDAISKSGASHQLWKSGGEFGGDVPGGFVEKIWLPVNGKESILLLRSSLDERLAPAQTNPPTPESFRVFFSIAHGKWMSPKTSAGGITAGRWGHVRQKKERNEYGVTWGMRDRRGRIEVYTVLNGELQLVEWKTLPSQEDLLDMRDSMEEAHFKKWLEVATAPPSGMSSYEPKREWIRLTDLMRNPPSKRQWVEGEPSPESINSDSRTDVDHEITFEAFARWLGK